MIQWLTDTLVATGVLMALVLLVRRAVARWFGPAAAYALWTLPMIRLVLPPLALPSSLLPRLDFPLEQATAAAAGTQTAISLESMPVEGLAGSGASATVLPIADMATAAPMQSGLLADFPWSSLALAVWLGGAVLFLLWRTVTYRWMRRDLLNDARLVARSGMVRIVESPAINAPLAFGVKDRVVALPMGFLADADSETSDFAIAHEMEHHAGNDLLALIVMQPLFALHWFNPIGWAGWRAVRGDQEAACDARVMAGRSRAERARYGRLIASLAGGMRMGLAAPMAGPLSGDKPIIHRLRALTRSDVTPARRVLARSLFALAIAAVPATATVSRAAMDEPGKPDARLGRTDEIEPGRRGAPPAGDGAEVADMAAEAPDAPEPPEAPEMAEAPDAADGDGVVQSVPPVPPLPPLPPVPAEAFRDASNQARHAARRADDAARYANETQRRAADARARAPEVQENLSADGKRHTIRIVRKGGEDAGTLVRQMVLDSSCPADSRRGSRSQVDSRASVVICTGEPSNVRMIAVNAIRSARASIAANRDMDAQVRAEILADLDQEIEDALEEAREI